MTTNQPQASARSAFVFFAIIIFVITFADAIMSYITPIYIDSKVSSPLVMGLIFATSSVVGIACDILFPKLFVGKNYFFFLKTTIITAMIFPLIYLLFPAFLATFFLAMIVWGIYYELNTFASFQFIHNYLTINNHAQAWGLLGSVQSLAYALAPLLAVILITHGFNLGFWFAIFVLMIGLLLVKIFKVLYKPRDQAKSNHVLKKSWTAEWHIWQALATRVWPLMALQLAVITIDAGFWTIGALYMQELAERHPLGNLYLTAYMLPTVIVGIFINKLQTPWGKKRTALVSSIIAGICLTAYSLTNSVSIILIITVIASAFLSIAVPEIKATFEDYVSRLKNESGEMIGIQASSSSLAYVFGPIIATGLATIFDFRHAFSILGLALAIISLFLTFHIPKRINMPQQILQGLSQ